MLFHDRKEPLVILDITSVYSTAASFDANRIK